MIHFLEGRRILKIPTYDLPTCIRTGQTATFGPGSHRSNFGLMSSECLLDVKCGRLITFRGHRFNESQNMVVAGHHQLRTCLEPLQLADAALEFRRNLLSG